MREKKRESESPEGRGSFSSLSVSPSSSSSPLSPPPPPSEREAENECPCSYVFCMFSSLFGFWSNKILQCFFCSTSRKTRLIVFFFLRGGARCFLRFFRFSFIHPSPIHSADLPGLEGLRGDERRIGGGRGRSRRRSRGVVVVVVVLLFDLLFDSRRRGGSSSDPPCSSSASAAHEHRGEGRVARGRRRRPLAGVCFFISKRVES